MASNINYVLIASALTFAVVWALPPTEDTVPESVFVSMDEMLDETAPASKINDFLVGTRGKSDAEVSSMIATLVKQEPESIKALNDAIEKIIEDVVKSHKASQKLINAEIDSYATCAAMPLFDKEANENAAMKKLAIKPAKKEQADAQEGNIKYDFGKNTATSSTEAGRVKSSIDAYRKLFDDAWNKGDTAQREYDAAQEASDKADAAKKEANHQCYCAARKAYDDVSAAVKESNQNDKANLKHFQMIQCVMAEFEKGVKEDGAFTSCQGKTYEDKVVTIDYRESDAELNKSITCDNKQTQAVTMKKPSKNPPKCTDKDQKSSETKNCYKQYSKKGGCCSNGGFHRRLHNAKKDAGCKNVCDTLGANCLGYVIANHGCQVAVDENVEKFCGFGLHDKQNTAGLTKNDNCGSGYHGCYFNVPC